MTDHVLRRLIPGVRFSLDGGQKYTECSIFIKNVKIYHLFVLIFLYTVYYTVNF